MNVTEALCSEFITLCQGRGVGRAVCVKRLKGNLSLPSRLGLTSQNELGYRGESRIQGVHGQLVLSAAQGLF